AHQGDWYQKISGGAKDRYPETVSRRSRNPLDDRRRRRNFPGVDRRAGGDVIDLSHVSVDMGHRRRTAGFRYSRHRVGTFPGMESGKTGSDRGFALRLNRAKTYANPKKRHL